MKKLFILALLIIIILGGIEKNMGNENSRSNVTHSTDPFANLELSENIIYYDPAIEIYVYQYQTTHPSSALIYVDERNYSDEPKGMLLYEGPALDIALLHAQLNQLGDRTYNCIMPDNWMEQMGISLEPQEDLEHTYSFIRDTNADTDLFGFCNPIRLCSSFSGEEEARVYGSLRALYGEPDYETDDTEDMYQYKLLVTRDDGKQAIVLVYSGSTGASVSSSIEDAGMKEGAAFVLKQLLEETTPADYDYQGYYWDGPAKIECGVKDGQPYYQEQELNDIEK